MIINPYIYGNPSTLNTGLFGVWNGDNNANDSFGTKNGTAQGGLTYTTGKVNQAFNFNGTNAYVSFSDNQTLKINEVFSISVWVKPSNLSNLFWIVSDYPFEPGGGQRGYAFLIDNATPGFYYVRNNGFTNGENNYLGMGSTISLNVWSHIVFVFNQGVSYQYYLNGTLVRNQGQLSGNIIYPYNTVYDAPYIGSTASTGLFDGVTMWNKALTQVEVTELYNSGNGKQYPF